MTLIDKAEALAAIEKALNNATGDLYDAYAAIAALPARGVGVKPLVWDAYPIERFAGPDIAVADAPFNHRYQVQRDPWAQSYMAFLYPILPITDSTSWWESKGHATIEAAKAAAQADYEARILAVLAPHGRLT